MQRDMDLLRLVMLSAEAGPPYPPIAGCTEDAIKYHQMQAIQMGLLDGAVHKVHTHPTEIPGAVIVRDVTPAGHDFLQAIREDDNWHKVKTFIAKSGKALTLEMVLFAARKLFGPG